MTIEQAINEVIVDKLKGLIVSNDMVATGALLASVGLKVSVENGVVNYDIVALDYIEWLNYGFPGSPEPTFRDWDQEPLVHKLQEWIDAKGLDLNPFAVRANILKMGTTWHRQGGSHIITDSINPGAFARVLELAGPDVQNRIKRTIQVMFTQPDSFDVALDEGFFNQ